MRLVAIYNCWADGLDLLPYSVDNILPVVDAVIIVWAHKGNSGEFREFIYDPTSDKVKMYQCERSEIEKRNFGLEKAKQLGFTHFIMMDSDEFYIQEEVKGEKERVVQEDLNGLVCQVKVLFKKPTFCLDDHTLVPFISKLFHDTQTGNFKFYPFAYDDKGNAHIDPTRRLNCNHRVLMSRAFMYHASWIRSDVDLKIRNSAARNSLERSTIYSDLEDAEVGVYNHFYRDTITHIDNIFNLPEL